MAFFTEIKDLPKVTIKILDIGAGIGTISFYFINYLKVVARLII
jgi:tRNA1(Val) A37 N6-methylase TrmN6